jgi:hypothetical protein
LADRGYLDLTYLRDIDRHGGFFILRSKAGLNPRVIDAQREDGQRQKVVKELWLVFSVCLPITRVHCDEGLSQLLSEYPWV